MHILSTGERRRAVWSVAATDAPPDEDENLFILFMCSVHLYFKTDGLWCELLIDISDTFMSPKSLLKNLLSLCLHQTLFLSYQAVEYRTHTHTQSVMSI